MDNFNRIISFVLGLIVVIVFLAIVTGRIGLKGRNLRLGGSVSPTPTPSGRLVSPSVASIIPTGKYQVNKPPSIPATGLPTLTIPLLISLGGVGVFLRKSGKER